MDLYLIIAALTALAMVLLALPFTEALLLGTALAPADPVLAADVQFGGPEDLPSGAAPGLACAATHAPVLSRP